MPKYKVEFTDTFGGEANYCWVERHTVEADDMKKAITKAKQERYHSPLPRHRTSDVGDMVRIDIVGANVCAFITLADEEDEPETAPAPEAPQEPSKVADEPKLNYSDDHIQIAKRHSLESLRGVKLSTNTKLKQFAKMEQFDKKKAYKFAKKQAKFYRKLVKIKQRMEK